MSPHQALGLGEDAKRLKKKTCCHLKPLASPLAPGGGGQEMPGEEQQGKVIQERTWFTTGLVGEGRISRCWEGGNTSTWGESACSRIKL